VLDVDSYFGADADQFDLRVGTEVLDGPVMLGVGVVDGAMLSGFDFGLVFR